MDQQVESVRLVAVTRNPSLVIGLTFLGRDWDVNSSEDGQDLPDGDVLVVDLGSTEAAVALLDSLGDGRAPAVVVGDGDESALNLRDRLVRQPYTLQDLADEVDHALAGPRVPAAGEDDQPDGAVEGVEGHHDRTNGHGPTTGGADASVVGAEADVSSASDAATSETRTPGSEAAGELAAQPEAADQPTGEPETGSGSADEPKAGSGPGMIRSWADRLSRRSTPSPTGATSEPGAAADPLPADDDRGAEELLFDGRGSATDESPPTPPPVPPPAPVIDLTDQGPFAEPIPPPAPVGPRIVRATAPVTPPVPDTPTSSGGEPTVKRSLFASRRVKPEGHAERAMRERLAEVISAGVELEQLCADVPLLRSLPGLARAVVAEVHAELQADVVVFFDHTDDGYVSLASIGLTPHERTLVIPLDQPMLSEVDRSGGGLLIDPIEAAQAAVAGIAGAHTESFMVASISAGPGRFGLLAVGRNEPLRTGDLDRLLELAIEAGPGVATAQLLRRLGALVIQPTRASAPRETRSYDRTS